MKRRVPLLAVLFVALAVTGTVSTIERSRAPQLRVTNSSLSQSVQSSAFYCTGLTDAAQGASGVVTIVNTANSARTVTYTVSDEVGATSPVSVRVGAHQSISVAPDSVVASSHGYGFSAQVNGGGVFGEERITGSSSQEQCSQAGVTSWYEAGLDTTVGSSGYVSVLNPTATPAVFNIAVLSSSGYSAPQPYQGVAVPAHAEVQVDLGRQIVNANDIGVHVQVLRGALVISGVEVSGSVGSLSTGMTSTSDEQVFPLVTTANNTLATIEVMNPTDEVAQVSMKVSLASFTIAPQTVSVQPYSSNEVVITPNPAVPAAGEASVTVSSNVPVASSLYEGTSSGLSLSSPASPVSEVVALGEPHGSLYVTNTSAKTIHVKVSALGSSYQSSVSIVSGVTADISAQDTWISDDQATLFSTTSSSLVVNQLLTTKARASVLTGP